MVAPQLHVLALRRHFARDVQLPGPYVEVGRGYADREVHGDAGRGHGAAVGFFGYTAHGARAQEVVGLDQVVGVPLRSCSVQCGVARGEGGTADHVFWLFGEEGRKAGAIFELDLLFKQAHCGDCAVVVKSSSKWDVEISCGVFEE